MMTIPSVQTKNGEEVDVTRYRWVVDDQIPIFTQNRNYIEQHVYIEEE
ncbi:hypothetical protein C8P63_12120 [Melghirimyces profundicolus]|uniref:Uncharacterized protein n=1 Tax=Melghirimyces profundicolus TaxID=1242148 RepID=A0A2T6BGG1_9BACL|nr:hypothetical protein C8P63_12120 [Melghirimyces profundicolus]